MHKNAKWRKSFQQNFVDGLEVVCAEAKGRQKGNIVFVHGVCHGAWCWERFLKYFSEKGYHCFALSLRGHGESKGRGLCKLFYKLSCYVADVEKIVEYCQNKTHAKPYIIGHSMGGAIVQKYLDSHSDAVSGAVLLAPVTAGGMGIGRICATCVSKSGWCTAPTVLTGHNRTKWLRNSNFFVAKGDKGHAVPRITDEKELAYFNEQLCSESPVAMLGLARYRLDTAIEVPVFVIGSHADAYFPRESLETTEARYGTKHFAFEDLCHDMMLDEKGWEDTACAILGFLDERR